jgi:2-oxo-4-hydroxy-4-carboxy-5-ureidoimidazoline decarboxylase
MKYSLVKLNQMSQEAFTEALGAIFEHTPAIAHRTWYQRPFADIADLHTKMVVVVDAMNQEEKLALIQAHPDLGSKTKMAEASVKEQAGAGLDQLSAEEYERFHSLNQAYREKFGFPFIVAVKNHTRASILEAFERRTHNSSETEIQQAIAEILQIAQFRLTEAILPLCST